LLLSSQILEYQSRLLISLLKTGKSAGMSYSSQSFDFTAFLSVSLHQNCYKQARVSMEISPESVQKQAGISPY
jgi:hypothetical protein